MARADQNKSIAQPTQPGDSEGAFTVSPSDISAGTGSNPPASDRPVNRPPFNPIPNPILRDPTPKENADKILRDAAREARRKGGGR